MNADAKTLALLGGIALLLTALSRKTLALPGAAVEPVAIEQNARAVSAEFPNVDPLTVVTIAMIESGGNPIAVRFEPHISDVSIGLMQTLLTTARWLASDLGYTRYGVPSYDDLLEPDVSLYFGMAYLQWLSTYRGERRSEEWIVKSYNGGPGADGSQVRAYWQKYLTMKSKILNGQV